MIHSMTGFGKHILQLPGKKISVEIKSLNSKNLDVNARLSGRFRESEIALRRTIATELKRGKVDLSVYVEELENTSGSKVNTAVVKSYLDNLRDLQTGANEAEMLAMAMRLPDTLMQERQEMTDDESKGIAQALDEAIVKLHAHRRAEGVSLEHDFTTRITNIGKLAKTVKAMDGDRIAAVKERLSKALEELEVKSDPNRYEQELIFYLEKLDINEELVRLDQHLIYFMETMNEPQSNGKKLGFICQEIGREVNTLGSKSNYATMQQTVVQMKDELEKIKEQVLNVL